MKVHVTRTFLAGLDTAIGTVLCVSLAVLGAAIVSSYSVSLQLLLPLLFVGIVLAAASRYGVLTGVLGSVLSAAIFALFLFTPTGSLRVEDAAARDHLGWMLMLGISLSFLFGASGTPSLARRSIRSGSASHSHSPSENESRRKA